MTKIPKRLQPILWSRDIKNLDLKRDKAYIINQILAYGTAENLIWLFRNYPKAEVVKTFIHKPIKIYSHSAFNFIKTILFEKPDNPLSEEGYVQNLPRNIG